MSNATVVIVMPTYNEAGCIKGMVDVLWNRVFPSIQGAQMHLLIVDDNSPDGTGELVRELAGSHPGLHLLTGQKRGLGWAYVRGMREAMGALHADAVIEMDADFQHDPAYLPAMVQLFLDGADYVIGSRYAPEGSVPASWPLHRKLLSAWGNQAARFALRMPQVHDFTTGFRLTRVAGVLDLIVLEKLFSLDQFAFKTDLLFQTVQLARTIRELPIDFKERSAGSSKFSLHELAASLSVLLRLRFFPRR